MDKRVWLAVNRTERKVESCIVGTSDKSYAVRCLLETLTGSSNPSISYNIEKQIREEFNTINIVATDGNYAYDKVVKHNIFKQNINHHIVDKSETCLVEAYNSSMRDRLARLTRKTKAFSRSKEMLHYSLVLWKERKNTGRRDWKKFLLY